MEKVIVESLSSLPQNYVDKHVILKTNFSTDLLPEKYKVLCSNKEINLGIAKTPEERINILIKAREELEKYGQVYFPSLNKYELFPSRKHTQSGYYQYFQLKYPDLLKGIFCLGKETEDTFSYHIYKRRKLFGNKEISEKELKRVVVSRAKKFGTIISLPKPQKSQKMIKEITKRERCLLELDNNIMYTIRDINTEPWWEILIVEFPDNLKIPEKFKKYSENNIINLLIDSIEERKSILQEIKEEYRNVICSFPTIDFPTD